jgi:hypothetical protein
MVAVVVATDATEMIPLLDDNGAGVYNKGRNNILEFRREFLGALVGKSGSSPFAWRPGVLAPGAFSGGSWIDKQVFQVGGGGGSQAVGVRQGRSLVNRSGIGPYLLSQDGDIASIAAPAADGTNPRIDLFCEMGYDKGAVPSDAQHGPKFIWVTGDPGAVPATPALPAAVADANILATVTRAANDNTIATADIADSRKSAGLQGAPRVLLPGDSLADAGSYHGEQRFRQLGISASTDLDEIVDRWSATDSKWHGTQTVALYAPAQSFSGTINNGVTTTIATFVVPDLGFDWRPTASGSFEYTTADAAALVGCQLTYDSSTIDTNPIARGLAKFQDGAGGTKWACAVADTHSIPTLAAGASRTIRMLAKNYSAASGISVVNGGQWSWNVLAVPV